MFKRQAGRSKAHLLPVTTGSMGTKQAADAEKTPKVEEHSFWKSGPKWWAILQHWLCGVHLEWPPTMQNPLAAYMASACV